LADGFPKKLRDASAFVPCAPSRAHYGRAWEKAPSLVDILVIPYSVLPGGDEPMSWPLITSLRLAVEIISPSSVHTDRIVKRDHYLEAEEYGVMDLEARMVERWLADRDRPIAVRDRLTWHPQPAKHPFAIDLESFFRGLRAKRGRHVRQRRDSSSLPQRGRRVEPRRPTSR
jgi:hypothetical protein